MHFPARGDCYGGGELRHRYRVQDIASCWGFPPRQGRTPLLSSPSLPYTRLEPPAFLFTEIRNSIAETHQLGSTILMQFRIIIILSTFDYRCLGLTSL